MAQADSNNSTAAPVAPTRRRFLSQAAGVAAGGAALALATTPPAFAAAAPAGRLDPALRLIAAHRAAGAAHRAALEEMDRLEKIGDLDADGIAEGPCDAEMDAFNDLIETAPMTFAGLVAWSYYLDEIRQTEPWMFEERGPTLVVTLVEALGNLAAPSRASAQVRESHETHRT
jgi:hypothetical protein